MLTPEEKKVTVESCLFAILGLSMLLNNKPSYSLGWNFTGWLCLVGGCLGVLIYVVKLVRRRN